MKEENKRFQRIELVRSYVSENQDLPSTTIARIIFKEHPLLFRSLENVRSAVRYVRGNYGEFHRKIVKNAGKDYLFRPNQKPDDYFKQIPKGLSQFDEEWGIVDIDISKALLLYDIHVPFHDRDALKTALNFGLDAGCKDVIISGDFIDCFSVSDFRRDPTVVQFKDELEMAKNLLAIIRNLYPEGKIYFKEGNHEERLERYLELRAPELLGIKNFTLKEVIGFDDLGIEYIGDKRPLRIDKLHIIHGHEFVYSAYNPVNPARGYFLKGKVITIGGHYHQTSEHTEMSMDGKLISVWSSGCLCDLHPKYMPINKWNHGFAIVDTTTKSRRFKVDNYRIIKGEVL